MTLDRFVSRTRQAPFIVGALLGAVAVWMVNGHPSSAAPEVRGPIMRTDDVSRIVRDRSRSVVLLHSIVGAPQDESGDPLAWLIRPPREVLGSGIVIDDDGLILTNAHVVQRAGEIHVRRPDGEDVNTTLVGTDPDSDLALVRVADPTGLVPAPFGDSDRIEVGNSVVAIGSPLGLHHTVTTGVLSAKARGLDESGLEFLQTDAAVNPGSSGGPLLDLSGKVIGVITAIVSDAGENVGLNFAIPINEVKAVLPALRTNSVTRAWLGIMTVGLSPTGAKAFGLAHRGEGLLITAVQKTGPAARGGVQPGDVLLGLASDPAVRAQDVFRRIRTMPPGSTVRLKVLRDDDRLELPVVLDARPTFSDNSDGARPF